MAADADLHVTRFVARLRPQVQGELAVAALAAPAGTGEADAAPLAGCRLAAGGPEDVSAALSLASETGMPVCFASALPAPGSPAALQMRRRCKMTGWLLIDSARQAGAGGFDAEQRRMVVAPGVRLVALNRFLFPHGLWLPIESGVACGATIAGLAGRNTAALSVGGGAMVDHLQGIDARLADGTAQLFGPFGAASSISLRSARAGQLVSALFGIASTAQADIQAHWPAGLRQPDGYALDCFHPRPARPYTGDGSVNLAHLLAGSAGTLAWSDRLHLRLVPRPAAHRAGLFIFASAGQALAVLADVLRRTPSAVLLLDGEALRRLADSPAPADAALTQGLADALRRCGRSLAMPADGDEAVAALLVRFSGQDEGGLERSLQSLAAALGPGVASGRAGVRLVAMPAASIAQARSGPVWQQLLDEGAGDEEGASGVAATALAAARQAGWSWPATGGVLVLPPGAPAQLAHWVACFDEAVRRAGGVAAWRGQLAAGELTLRLLPGRQLPARVWQQVETLAGRLFAGRWTPALQQAFAGVRQQFDPQGLLAPGQLPLLSPSVSKRA